MANLVFLPIADRIESATYLLYDGACGTGGMLTVAEEVLHRIAEERGKQVSSHLYGQEINGETYATCKADLLLKGEGEAADNIVGGPEHSTLSSDAFPSREFDFMLSNPPYGKSWKTDLERMGGKKEMRDPRFVIEHADDPEYSLVTRSSDGQMLFLANKLSKMKQETTLECPSSTSQKSAMSRGITIEHIYGHQLKRLAVPIPPLPEQTGIARLLDAADRRISARRTVVEREIELLREYRTRLIADTVTGKLDVRQAAACLPDGDDEKAPERPSEGLYQ